MGFLAGAWEHISPQFFAAWILLTEFIPNRDAFLAELSSLKDDVASVFGFVFSVLESRIFVFIAALICLYKLYGWVFRPFSGIRLNHEVGYIPETRRQSLHERATDVRRRRRTGELPPVYPNGWFKVIESRDLKAGTSKQVSMMGMELAVFRTEAGQPAILDAYCPHLGANLAAGGNVEGDHLHCPFHGWQFNKVGVCVKIPYCDASIPSNANVKSYPCLEINGQILVWYDAEGREPFWQPPSIPQLEAGTWRFCGETFHALNCHVEEVPENAADVPHLEYLHGPFIDRYQFLRHVWQGNWAPVEEEGKKHISVLNLVHMAYFFGFRCPPMDLHVTASQIGPGLVYLTWKSMMGEGCFVQALTPTEPLLQHLTHCVYASWTVPTFVAKFFMLGEMIQVERDVMVWNNKMYRSNPVLCKGDTLIKKHRAWFSQFYTEHSPTYESAMAKSASW